MAFQIIDDILDLTGDSNKTGKAVGNDLMEGVYTLPLLIALRNNKEAFDKILKEEEYSKEEILEIIDLIKENGGIEKSMEIANKYSNKAFKNILNLPENEYRDILMEITKNMLSREQ